MNLKTSHISQSKKIKIGITLGDPSGIGPEIIAKALGKRGLRGLAKFVIIGDKKVFDTAQGVSLPVGRKLKAGNFQFLK